MYRPTGAWRGAPQTVTDIYAKLVAAYRAGDSRAASAQLGLLSHYYSDVCVPFHSGYEPNNSQLHANYEAAVNERTDAPGENADWLTLGTRELVPDIRAKTVAAAMLSRQRTSSLTLSYGLYDFDVVTAAISREMLSRAVNDLADVIKSVPYGSGISGPGNLSLSMSHPYPRQNSTLTAQAVCKTTEGAPIEGERVAFTWKIATQTMSTVAVSDEFGIAKSKRNIGRAPKGQPATVTATAEASGETRVKRAKFTPTDVVGLMDTYAERSRPTQDTTLTIITNIANRNGQAIPGLKVTFSWYHRTKTVTYTAYTDELGVAVHSRNIGHAAAGRRVYVRAKVLAGGRTHTSWTSFVPKAKPKPKPKPKPRPAPKPADTAEKP
jgi:hypothetical protein